MNRKFLKNILPLSIIPSIFFTDFFIKRYIEQYGEEVKERQILGKKIKLKKHYNTGMAMDLMPHKTEWVLSISSIILTMLCFAMAIVLPKHGKKLITYGLSFVIGGAAGNVYDRALHHYVLDYFSFQTNITWIDRIIFNISDISIFFGMFLIVIGDILGGNPQKL